MGVLAAVSYRTGFAEWDLWIILANLIVFLTVYYAYWHVYLKIPNKDTIFFHSLKAAARPLPTQVPPPCKLITKQKFDPQLVPDIVDAVIVGSGIGGLTTACILAKAGWKVVVLEQHGKAGGCCHTFSAQKHFEFDTGIHFVGKMDGDRSTSLKLLNMLAVQPVQWVSHGDPFDTVTVEATNNNEQHKYEIGIGQEKLRAMLEERFPDEKEAITKFFHLLSLDKSMGDAYVLGKSLPAWIYKRMASSGAYNILGKKMRTFFEIGQSRTLDVLDCLTNNDELKSLLLYLLPAIGFDTLPATWYITAGVWLHYLMQGSWYPKGGSSQIVQKLVPTILAHGGQVLTRADVQSIMIGNDGRVKGVSVLSNAKTYEIRTPIVVSNAGVSVTFNQMLPPTVSEKSRYKKYADLTGASLHLVFIGLDGDANDLKLDTKNHHFMRNAHLVQSLKEYSQLTNDEILDAPLPFFSITFPSAKDPEYKERHPGKTVCTMAAPTNSAWYDEWQSSAHKRRPEEYKHYKQQLMHHIWSHALRHFPHLEDKVEYMDMATPLTIEHYLRSRGGACCSIPHDEHRFAPDAVADLRAETDVSGLYLTGQDILTGGFTGALQAGWFAAEAVLSRFGAKR